MDKRPSGGCDGRGRTSSLRVLGCVRCFQMFASITSVALVGVEARPVSVEAHVGGGQRQSFHLVGLPDTAVREAKERVAAALAVSGFRMPAGRVTVNLAPADLPKVGSAFDLPIALAILAAVGTIPPEVVRCVALGELALDGRVRAARGGLGAALVGREVRLPVLLSAGSAAEAALVADATVWVVDSLGHAVAVGKGEAPPGCPEPVVAVDAESADLAQVRGQGRARRALEIAAAGGHHLLLTGPPGAGKTMLAHCLPSLLPSLGPDERLEVAQVWAAADRPRPDHARPPIRAPHHSATTAALVGGGSGVPVPGEISLAHRGVLFLDEMGEFSPALLDALRQPLEQGTVTIARQGRTITFPSDLQLVAATNPCPCGYLDDEHRSCMCSPTAIERYRRRLSGPLLDRIDVRIWVGRPDPDELLGPSEERSQAVRTRVLAARARQTDRGTLNRGLTRSQLDELAIAPAASDLAGAALRSGAITGRGYHRLRRIGRTIADLAGEDLVSVEHLEEALDLRGNL